MTQTMIGVFDTYHDANGALEALVANGIPRSSVEIHSGVSETDASTPVSASDRTADHQDEGILDKIERFFSNLVGDDDERPREFSQYKEAVRRGSSLVSVDIAEDSQLERVRNILESAGAIDIDERAAQWNIAGDADYSNRVVGSDASAATTRGIGSADTDSRTSGVEPTSVPRGEGGEKAFSVVKEELEVGKRRVQTGAFRVYSRVTETPVSESVTLREEHASVERRPVDRPATSADLKEGFVEVRETQETPVVQKTARVVEEVVVGKQASERTETVSDTVRGTQVDVERIDGKNGRPTDNSRTDADDTSRTNDPLKPHGGKI